MESPTEAARVRPVMVQDWTLDGPGSSSVAGESDSSTMESPWYEREAAWEGLGEKRSWSGIDRGGPVQFQDFRGVAGLRNFWEAGPG